jgi:hypothetical protein
VGEQAALGHRGRARRVHQHRGIAQRQWRALAVDRLERREHLEAVVPADDVLDVGLRLRDQARVVGDADAGEEHLQLGVRDRVGELAELEAAVDRHRHRAQQDRAVQRVQVLRPVAREDPDLVTRLDAERSQPARVPQRRGQQLRVTLTVRVEHHTGVREPLGGALQQRREARHGLSPHAWILPDGWLKS